MNTILFCSCGRRVQLLKFLKQSLGDNCQIICADNSPIAPALYIADKHFIVPKITDKNYIETILNICKENNVNAITTLIDPEIEILAKNRELFLQNGILPLCPERSTAAYCFDKYQFFKHLSCKGINTVLTYNNIASFRKGLDKGEITFPVFIKPIAGSGSVGIHKVNTMNELQQYFDEGEFTYIIQEFMNCEDCDADVYIDTISHEPVAAFSKRKLETKIGGASKTISFKDEKLFAFIKDICKVLEFNGPVDMDFWYKDSEYYLSEVNPRFGGAYLHAYGAGVDFFKLIANNIKGIQNQSIIGQYKEDVLMLMYDGVVIVDKKDLAK